MNLWDEIRRRHVVQVGAIYLAAAWLIAQVAEFLLSSFNQPEWIIQSLIAALGIGFLLTLLAAWVFERRGLRFIPQSAIDEASDDVVVIPALPPDSKSIAVLPFINMSDDEGTEYFSDGISEELLNVLAKLSDLKVMSRSTSFAYKGKSQSVKEIAAEINCANVLEGSIRKAGNEVRITARLIQIESDTVLWSNSYDRTFDDIFKVQDDIAKAVVGELKIKLLGDMPKVKETDPETYALYLQALLLSNQLTEESLVKCVALCEEAISRDPDYAPSWVCLGRSKANQAKRYFVPLEEGMAASDAAYERAVEIDPENAQGLSHLARNILSKNGDLRTAANLLKRAAQSAPRDVNVLRNLALFFACTGRPADTLRQAKLAFQADPANPVNNMLLTMSYLHAGELEYAVAAARRTRDISPSMESIEFDIASEFLRRGDLENAQQHLENEPSELWRRVGAPMIFHLKGDKRASDEALRGLIEKHALELGYYIAGIHAFRGDVDEAFEWLEKEMASNSTWLQQILLDPFFGSLTEDPRWQSLLSQLGLAPEQLANIHLEIRLADELHELDKAVAAAAGSGR